MRREPRAEPDRATREEPPSMTPDSMRSRARAWAALAVLVVVAAGRQAGAAEVDPWAKGTQWVSMRAGYAKSAAKGSGNALGGYGFGYTRFYTPKWAFGAHVHHEVLGRFGGAAEVEVPFTVEVMRHFKWSTPLRPYLGLGTGAFFHKTYRTGDDETSVRKGIYVGGGVNAPIDARSLLGLDVRAIDEFDAKSTNPVFPLESSSALHWSIKLNYARFF
jgi:hypothetical protein